MSEAKASANEVRLSESARQLADQLRDVLNLKDRAEVVNSSVIVTAKLTKTVRSGGQIFVRKGDGSVRELVIRKAVGE